MSEAAKAAKTRRLAAALRSNLRRRKAAAGRSPAPEDTDAGLEPGPTSMPFDQRADFDRRGGPGSPNSGCGGASAPSDEDKG